jgi:hypothetical protein
LASQRFNDEDWSPTSFVLKDWGEWFVEEHDLSWAAMRTLGVSDPLTADNFKKRFQDLMRANTWS